MTEGQWGSWDDPLRFLQSLIYNRGTVAAKACTDRRLRLFAVACCLRMRDEWPDPRIAVAVVATEKAPEARTNIERQQIKAARRTVYADKSWLLTKDGGVARALVAHSALDAAIEASFYAGSLREKDADLAEQERIAQGPLLRDIVGNPFRPVTFKPDWRTSTSVAIARGMYESRDFAAMPILADALQDAGCDSDDVLNHCRDEAQVHVRGCWVVDLVLGKL